MDNVIDSQQTNMPDKNCHSSILKTLIKKVHEFNSNLLYFLHLECFYLLYHLIDHLECVILIHPRVKKRSEIKPINLISVLKS